MVKKILSGILSLVVAQVAFAQSIDQIINATEVERIEKTLSSNEMRGRKAGTPDIDRAADFIAAEFKKAGIQPIKGDSYFQAFDMLSGKPVSTKTEINGNALAETSVAVLTPNTDLSANQSSGYEVIKGENANKVFDMVNSNMGSGKNYLILLDTSNRRFVSFLKRFSQQMFGLTSNFVFILTTETPSAWSVTFKQELTTKPYKNVVGIIPGKSKKEEYFILSGHYDHLGVGKPNAQGDSIYNGANDDAAGTTAVIMLANYFAKQKNNERTLVFAAFTAEEVGGFGSQYFSKQFDPAKVMGMFNIEMIGTESKWGTNSAYITGYEKTDMGKILEKNLEGTNFKFYPDPYPQQQLFYRSDNATLARLGVPAHTISTSKMDDEKNYHQLSDEIGTLDMKNMAEIIKAIAISSASMIAGKDTPSRVDTKQLR
jgi:hypothetical protein